MKLRNRKTGEIREISGIVIDEMFTLKSLSALNEEWEDYEEPKCGYIIDPMDENGYSRDDDCFDEADRQKAKELGIWLETKEEAEKAVEKLKAWKRLKDAGCGFILDDHFNVKFVGPDAWKITSAEEQKSLSDTYNSLFGGEE